MENPINNQQFDSRDLIEYREELESQILNAYTDWAEDHNDNKDEDAEELEIPSSFDEIEFLDEEAFTSTCSDLIEEYEGIKEFCEELANYSEDFEHGETIIADAYFTEYCRELIQDIGDLPQDIPSYIENNINWDGVAEDMEVDYTRVSYDGNEYLIR